MEDAPLANVSTDSAEFSIASSREDGDESLALEAHANALSLQLEGQVAHNRAKVFVARSSVSEISTLAAHNNNNSFSVNRRIANENMDAALRIRSGIIQAMPVHDEMSFQFREAQLTKVKAEFLAFRSQVNDETTAITTELALLAEQSVAINKRILQANENIHNWNVKMIADNAQFYEQLKAELDKSTQDSILDIMRQNLALLHDLAAYSSRNASGVDALIDQTEAIKAQIATNAHMISTDRKVLVDFNHAIAENRAEVAAKLLLRGRASRIYSSLDEVFDGEHGSVSTRGSATKQHRRIPRAKQPTGLLPKPIKPTWKPNMTAAQLQKLQQQVAGGSDTKAAAAQGGGIASLQPTWCPKPPSRVQFDDPATPQRNAALRGASPLNSSGPEGHTPTDVPPHV